MIYKFIFILLFTAVSMSAQDSTGSLAFKKNRPVKKKSMFYQPDLSYRIWQQFNLIKEANSGNPLAQHELGLRYLLGEDQPADTLKAAEWIRKAALQKLPAAAFNYGILLYNGWGVKWNPFEAYKNFFIAAKDGMAQAEYIIGIMHTDNLIVKRDWGKAFYFVKRASDKGYKQASEILGEIRKQLPPDIDTSKKDLSYTTADDGNSPGLVFIDFDRPVTNPSAGISDSLLFEDLLLAENKKFESVVTLKDGNPEVNFDKDDIGLLMESASWGCPEALTLIGRLYEKGISFPKNTITAAAYYIRASKLDSYRSTILLYNLSGNKEFIKELQDAALKEEPEAMFVWYGLYAFNLDNAIQENDAVNLLKKSAERGYLPAAVELGLNLFTGKYFNKDIPGAVDIWNKAASAGSNEALIRLAASEVYGETKSGGIKAAVDILKRGNENGSILAQVVLGYAYEQGIIHDNNDKEIIYYRSAAQRGSRYAMSQLQRRYDMIRPSDPEFILE